VPPEDTTGALSEESAGHDPFALFGAWFAAAGEVDDQPEAMGLATVGADGRPSVRMVLLKGWDAEGFTFFTNYGSRKAGELDAHPAAALLFFWPALMREVRIEGHASRIGPAASDAYFATRPRGSQLGAHASAQSRPVASRAELERSVAEVEDRFAGRPVPRPEYWGGYRLVPDRFEFWQGRSDRLHDRLVFTRPPAGGPGTAAWTRVRLQP
jgi:pyridoxamine 5'-phosphate oxidase